MKKFILNLLFPVYCLACKKEGEFICSQCLKKIQEGCPSASKKIIAATDYKHSLIKKAIHRYKYDFVKELSKPLGTLMAKRLTTSLPCHSDLKSLVLYWIQDGIQSFHNYILIPVPLHKKRLRWRGFNQSELLAQEISKQLNIPVAGNILIRVKNTPPQAKIENILERETNIQNAFSLKGQSLINFENKTIILVDDIATTGATLQQCAKALKPLKPKSILGLVIAR